MAGVCARAVLPGLCLLGACGRLGFDPLPGAADGVAAADGPFALDATGPNPFDPDSGFVIFESDAPPMPDADPAAPDAAPGPDVMVLAPTNDRCNQELQMVADTPYTMTTCGARDDLDTTCGTPGTPDVFFRFTGAGSATYRFRLTGTGFIRQFAGFCSTSASCGSSPLTVTFPSGGGNMTFIVEDGDGGCGTFTFEVESL